MTTDPVEVTLVTVGLRVASAVYISSSWVAPILQFENVCDQRFPVNFALPKLLHAEVAVELPNPAELLEGELIFVSVSSGIFCNEEQVENIPLMFVTEAVLNNGTDCKESQEENICDMFVTKAVLKSGTDCNEEHALNINDMLVTEAVLNSGTDCKDSQL